MTKTILLLALVFWSISGFTQTFLEFSAGAGGSRMRAAKNAGSDFSRITHFQFGIDGERSLSEYTSVKAGLHYSRRGGAIGESFFYGTTFTQLKMNSLEIPVLLMLRPQNLVLFVGPQYALLLNAKHESADVTNSLNTSSMDIRFGGGYSPQRGFGAQIHFVKGLSDITKQDGVKITTNYFSLVATYRMRT
jgi:hypothetical protein